jgi:Flp pilus assembly protein TadG
MILTIFQIFAVNYGEKLESTSPRASMLLNHFFRDRRGGIAPLLALTIIPVMGAVGAAVDYSRASAEKAGLQAALDSAMLYAAKADSADWQQIAMNAFNAMVAKKDATVAPPIFTQDVNENYVGQLTAEVPTRVSGFLGISSITVNVTSAVKPGSNPDLRPQNWIVFG